MKKYILYILMFVATASLGSCNSDDDIDTANSIFDTTTQREMNDFDKWLLDNYVYPYNIQLKYLLDDNEISVEYDLVPAKYEQSVAIAKIVKHVWLEAYDELWGINMTRTYVPKLLHFIGNVAYTQSGMILGQAEGGMKVTLFRLNEIDLKKINVAALNEYYFKTMHHEFTHILNQKKAYDPAYERISESDYVGGSWYQLNDSEALAKGFISPYSMDRASEDFAEIVANYVTNDADTWESLLAEAQESILSEDGETTARTILERKFDIAYRYMLDSWGLDLNELRAVVQRRQNEISELDLVTLKAK